MEHPEDIQYHYFLDAADDARVMAKQLGISVHVVREGAFWMIEPDRCDLTSKREAATQDSIDSYWQRRDEEDAKFSNYAYNDERSTSLYEPPEDVSLSDSEEIEPSDLHYDDHHGEMDPARPRRPIVNYTGRDFDDESPDDA